MMVKCRASTRQGRECPYDAVVDGLCMRHFQVDRGLLKSKKNEQNNISRY